MLQDPADFLDDLDQAWVAVLKGQVWDPRTAEGVGLHIPVEDVEIPSRAASDPSDASNTNPAVLPRPFKSSPPSQTDLTRLRSLLLGGESALEDWMGNQREHGDESAPDELENVSAMLDHLGLLDDFDSLFSRTFGLLGEFGGETIARDLISPDLNDAMQLDP